MKSQKVTKSKSTTPAVSPKQAKKSKVIISKLPRSKQQLETQPSLFEIQLELEALKEENLKCARQVAKLKAEITRLKNDNKILTEDIEKYKHNNPPLNVLHGKIEQINKLLNEDDNSTT